MAGRSRQRAVTCQVGDLPLAMVESPDGRLRARLEQRLRARRRSRSSIASTSTCETRLPLDHAWVGMAWHPDGKRLYVSGAGNNTVHELTFATGKLTRGIDLVLGRPMDAPAWAPNRPEPVPQSFVGGVAVSPDGVAAVRGPRARSDRQHGRFEDRTRAAVHRAAGRTVQLCRVARRRDAVRLAVGRREGAAVRREDARRAAARLPVGEHPNSMALTTDGTRLFVACANTNAVWAIDVAGRRAIEQIRVALYPERASRLDAQQRQPVAGRKRLLVANADNNTVAVVDVETPGSQPGRGIHADRVVSDGRDVQPRRPRDVRPEREGPRRRRRIRAAIQPSELAGGEASTSARCCRARSRFFRRPMRAALQTLTTMAYSVAAYSDAHRLAPARAPVGSPIPRARRRSVADQARVLRHSREPHVRSDLRRSRARQQRSDALPVFGDVTPNAHALAREFGVLDNFYVDAEVSYDGHAFSTAPYATDLVEKFWPTNYAVAGRRVSERGRWNDTERVRQHRRAARRLHLGRVHARERQRAQLRRVRGPQGCLACGRHADDHKRGHRGDRSRTRTGT